MTKFKDLTGQVFNRLTVTKFLEIKNGSSRWQCRCSCGNLHITTAANLYKGSRGQGGTQSCGCLQRENCKKRRLTDQDAGFRKLLTGYKTQAKKRKLAFQLTVEQFKYLTKLPCHYCEQKPIQESHPSKRKSHRPYLYNGIDRTDNSKGYIIGNVVSCCGRCNQGKMDSSLDEFKKWIRDVYQVTCALP